MQLYLKNKPILDIQDNGICTIFDFNLLPFPLRKQNITLFDFIEWASNRTLSLGRSYAKEILNSLRLSQTNRYALCKACRGLSLEDSYWLKQEGDSKTWEEVNLFHNPLTLFITEISLSGTNTHFSVNADVRKNIHTPELTTLGASAKGWIRHEDGLHLHKVGKYEIPAHQILQALDIFHVPYEISSEEEIDSYLSDERKEWLQDFGEVIVHSRLITSEDVALVTFEDFSLFCSFYGLNPYEEAQNIDHTYYLQMQIVDYILNNNDRHEQNWGFLMDNTTGKLIGYCPLFDHDHAFSNYERIYSQTTEEQKTLLEAAKEAQKELQMDFQKLFTMEPPQYLTEMQWKKVLERVQNLNIPHR